MSLWRRLEFPRRNPGGAFLRSIQQDAPVTRLVGLREFYRRTGGRESLLHKLGRQIPCRLRRKNVQKF